MDKNENFYSVKLVSNTGNKIKFNQVAFLCKKFNIPIEFFVDVIELGYSVVWFKLTKDIDVYTLDPIAYQFLDDKVQDFFLDIEITSAQKKLINDCIPIKLPNYDVIADENFLVKIKRYTESKKYIIVSKNFDWENFEDQKPEINWKKTIRVDIRKYNQDQLKIIAKKLQLLDWSLLYLKKIKAICVFWDTTKPYFMAFQLKEDSPIFSEEKYKGLNLWNEFYYFMTKKEKDKLIKLPATQIDTKKEPINKNTKSTLEQKKNQSFFNLDSILDKIIVSGLDSLSKEERNFLDSYSN